MGTKFFVYADNAWREVDTSTGRVVGWRGRAKFVYARRGRLHVAKSHSVLHALSAFAAGEPSAVRDGPRLSQLRCPDSHNLKALPELCNGQHSCGDPVAWNTNYAKQRIPIIKLSKIDTATQCNNKVDVSVQVDPSPLKISPPERCDIRINLVPVRRWERHERSRSEERATEPRRTRSSQRLNTSKDVNRRSRSTDDSSSEFTTRPTVKSERTLRSSKPSIHKVVEISTDSSAGDLSDSVNTRKRKLRKVSQNKVPAKKQKVESTDESSDLFETPRKSKTVALVRKVDTTTDDTDSDVHKKITRSNPLSSKRDSSSSDFVTKRSNNKVQIASRTRNHIAHSAEEVIAKQIEAYNFLKQTRGKKQRTACLELVIPEEDVSVLREFVIRTDCADLEKFDADDDYKRMLFYAINPLVDIEKCSQIERLLETKKLKKFAERLGLCSVSDVSSQTPAYRTRTSVRQANRSSDSDSETEKDTSPQRSNHTKKSANRKAKSSKDKPKDDEDQSRNDTNDSVVKTDRDRYKGKYVSEGMKKAIDRISKYNAERLNKTEENKTNRVKIQDRLEKTVDDVSKDISRKIKQILRRDKYGKFLSSRAKEKSRRPNGLQSSEVLENSKVDQDDRSETERRILKSSKVSEKSQNKKQDDTRSEKSTKSRDGNPDVLKKINSDKSRSRDNLERPRESRSRHVSKSNKITVESKENVPEIENRLRDRSAKRTQESAASIAVDSSKASELEKTGLSHLTASHVISNRASSCVGKEYTNLEDHAIVAYVSHGVRASHVNGNKLWRDLEEQYFNITGTKRSWHSLRNRYLRYILPRLGALRLPPSQESRLRAAAATGCIKTKHRNPDRRNSIFSKEAPQRGASDRRIRQEKATLSDAPGREATPPAEQARVPSSDSSRVSDPDSPRHHRRPTTRASTKSPRYSDVTRRFASRKLRSTPRDTPQKTPQKTNSPQRTKTRKLFNPRKEL